MTKIRIINKVSVRKYDYITIWVNEEKYHLKYNSEIIINIFEEEFEIIYSIFSIKSNKKNFKCFNKEKIFLELKSNVKLDILIGILNILVFIGSILIFKFFKINGINQILMLSIPIFIIFFLNMYLAVKTIEIIEKAK